MSQPLRIKICGMKDPENIASISALRPDYMGFIFYRESPRYAGSLAPEAVRSIPSGIVKTGVFVNEPVESILETTRRYRLDAIQLHGNETPEECAILKKTGLQVIKALSIADEPDLDAAENFQNCCDFLLFDTKTPLYGGSGVQYDWHILKNYTGALPFFLSGGIGPEDAERVRAFSHPRLHAIDLNSRFETEPGVKNTETLAAFLKDIRADQQDADY